MVLFPLEFLALDLALNLLYAFLRCRQIFRHGTTQFLDGLANLLTNLVVGIIRCLLPLDVLPAQLLVSLGRTEEIGGQFGAAHVIQNLLALLQPPSGRGFP